MPLDQAGVKEVGWLSKWAFQVGALAADAYGRQAIEDGYFAADATMRAKFADAFVNTAKLADSAVTSAKLANSAVSMAKLADSAVNALKLYKPLEGSQVYGVAFGVCRAEYSFASQGGAVGTIALLGATLIPANAVIFGGLLRITTALTSARAATAALQVEAADDIVAAALVSGAPWSTTGRKSVIPAFTGATSVLTTVVRDVSLVIGTADLTAGAFEVYLFYTVIA